MSKSAAATSLYKPLNSTRREIRILQILPPKKILDASIDIIETELVYIDLDADELPQYKAISYTWANGETNTRQIHVNGTSLTIGINLDNVLRRIRSYSELEIVWADAVCINQTDLEERASQVAMMHDIYNKADVVNVWLGLEDEKTNEATKFIEAALAQKDSLDAFYSTFTDSELWHKMGLVKDIFERPYWDRLWIVQEYLTTRSTLIFLGSSILTSSDLREFQNICIRGKNFSQRILFSTTDNWTNRGWMYNTLAMQGPRKINEMKNVFSEESTLFDTVRYLRGRHTTDPRDMIFAVVASFPREGTRPFPITYDKTTAQVYADFTRHQIRETHRLDCWAALTPQQSEVPNLPTWAIDWTQDIRKHVPLDQTRLDSETPRLGSNCDAAGGTVATLTNIERGALLLSVRGLRIGTVDDICCNATQLLDASTEEFLCTFEKWCQFIKPLVGTSETPNRYISLVRTLSLGIEKMLWVYKHSSSKYFLGALATAARELGECSNNKLFQKFSEYADVIMSPNQAIQDELTKNDFWWKILRLILCLIMSDRRLFITSTFSTIGVGPERMQIGDILCVPLGCAFVMVLRPQADGTHTVIGPSYVRGFMQAEAIQMQKRGLLELEDFVLR